MDANKFKLSRAQKRVLRRMNDYLKCAIKPRDPSKHYEEYAFFNLKYRPIRPSVEVPKVVKDSAPAKKDIKKFTKGQKKKAMRRERALQKMRAKGIDIEEVGRLEVSETVLF